MEVSLHFGAHRTGTTTFQRMMGQSGTALRAKGFAYWGPKRTRSDLFDGLIGRGAGEFPFALRRKAGDRVGAALRDLSQDGVQRLLVSEENMLGGLRQVLDDQLLYPDAAARAARIAKAFGDWPLRIGIGIRRYDAWWASAIAFSVAKSGPAPSDRLAAEIVAQPRRWRDVIGDLAEAFPGSPILVWTHEIMAARPEVVAAGFWGSDLPRLSGTRDWHNAAPTPAAMRGHLADRGISTVDVPESMGRFMPFDGTARRALQAQYSEDIAWLRSGSDTRITYIDDLGGDPVATGIGRGNRHEGRAIRN